MEIFSIDFVDKGRRMQIRLVIIQNLRYNVVGIVLIYRDDRYMIGTT